MSDQSADLPRARVMGADALRSKGTSQGGSHVVKLSSKNLRGSQGHTTWGHQRGKRVLGETTEGVCAASPPGKPGPGQCGLTGGDI